MKRAERIWRTKALSAPHRSFAVAHAIDRSGPRAGRRFAHTVEQFLEDDRVIVRLVLRGKEQGQAFSLAGKLVEPEQRIFGFRLRQLLEVFLAKVLPMVGPGMKPTA